MLAQDNRNAYERNDFSEPRLPHLPILRQVLNFLTWYIWFSLISNNLFNVQTTCSSLQNFYINSLLPHLLGAGMVLLGSLEMLSL